MLRYAVRSSLVALAAVGITAPSAGAALPRVPLPGSLPTFRASAPDLGRAAGTAPARAMISLRHRDQAGLLRFIATASDPRSSSYEHYLSPREFEARYAPTDATIERIKTFARTAGLEVVSVPRNNAYVYVTGTVAQAENAFGTTIDRYRLGKTMVQAPATAVRLPKSIAGLVTSVTGLNTGDVAHPRADPPAAYVNAGPCSTFWGQLSATGAPAAYGLAPLPDVPCGYTPQQLRGAYGTAPAIAAGLDGTGQTVAIIDAYSSPNIVSDATTYSQKHGLPDPQITVNDDALQRNTPEVPAVPSDIPIAGGLGVVDPQGWAGEETLDVEAVHSMAPGAKIVYQGADSPFNVDLQMAQNSVVADNVAQIISNSYGGSSDTTDNTSDGYWQQAAAQGQGVYFSSGDDGDQTHGDKVNGQPDTTNKSVDGGGNSPYVTSVGGTTLAVGAQDDYRFETYWGTNSSTLTNGAWAPSPPGDYNSGGGGGTSQVYAEPDYQKGVVPDHFARIWEGDPNAVSGGEIPGRVVPDVSMVGDPNSGFLMGMVQDPEAYQNPGGATSPTDATAYSEYRIGGTSLSSPLFAGVMALADQAAGRRHGFANPALYAAQAANAYHDVTAPASTVAVVRTNYNNNTNDADGTTTLLRTAGQLGSLSSVAGYDDSTGLGSPQGLAFLRALAPGSALIPADAAVSPPAGTTSSTDANGTGAAATSGKTTKPCAVAKKLSYVLMAPKHHGIVSVAVTAAGHRLVTRRGRHLTRVTISRPKSAKFTVVVTTLTDSGVKTRTTQSFSGCTKSKAHTTHLKTTTKKR